MPVDTEEKTATGTKHVMFGVEKRSANLPAPIALGFGPPGSSSFLLAGTDGLSRQAGFAVQQFRLCGLGFELVGAGFKGTSVLAIVIVGIVITIILRTSSGAVAASSCPSSFLTSQVIITDVS